MYSVTRALLSFFWPFVYIPGKTKSKRLSTFEGQEDVNKIDIQEQKESASTDGSVCVHMDYKSLSRHICQHFSLSIEFYQYYWDMY